MAFAASTATVAAFGALPTSVATPATQRSVRNTFSFNAGPVLKAFGLKARNSRLTCAYQITLKTPSGDEHVFECADDTYILDAAEVAGVDLPYSCRAGACCSCAGKIVSGKVDQNDGSFLDDEQMEKGFLLTCIAYPLSDCVIESHKEEEVTA